MSFKSRFIEMFNRSEYPSVRLSEVIRQYYVPEKIDNPEQESYITLSSHGRGIRKRIIKEGKVPVPFTGCRIKKGQFVSSRLHAKEGAFGIVPEELDGAVVSKDFPVFEIDHDRIRSEFLLSSVSQESFYQQFLNESFGSTTKRRIKEDTFLEYSIVLPPLEKQDEYVEFLQSINRIRSEFRLLLISLDNLVKSRFIEMFGTVDFPKVPLRPLGEVASYVNGYAFKPSDWGTDGLPIIRIQNLSGSGDQFNYYAGDYPEQIEINKGDIMISWSATLGVFEWSGPKALLNQHIFKVYFDKMSMDPTYFRVAVEPALKRSVSQVHGSTMTHLTKATFNAITIPVPPEEQQQEFADFVKQVDKSKFYLQEAIRNIRLLQNSILNSAFKYEPNGGVDE